VRNDAIGRWENEGGAVLPARRELGRLELEREPRQPRRAEPDVTAPPPAERTTDVGLLDSQT
jgi:hypothetical protein